MPNNNIYEYKRLEGIDYPLFLFTSDLGIDYTVRLEAFPYPFLGVSQIRKISVSVNHHEMPPFDCKVGPTICFILEEYLQVNNNEVMTYVCDDLDGRGHKRRSKFLRWYDHYSSGKYTALPQEIVDDDQAIYTCLIFDPRIYQERHIQAAYEDEIGLLASLKGVSQ